MFLLYLLQALIYPLTVASKSTTTARHNAANKILKNMCEHSNTLVQQAMMVSQGRADFTASGHRAEVLSDIVFLPHDRAAYSLWLPDRVPSVSPRQACLSLAYPWCFPPSPF